MRIDPNTKTLQASELGNQSGASAQSTSASASGVQGDDSAVLSPSQARLQALAAEANAFPEIRQQKVAALGRVVQQGNYQVSPEQTADALLSEMIARSAAA